MRRIVAGILLLLLSLGCAVRPVHDAAGIRLHTGRAGERPAPSDSLLVVSYNIKFAEKLDTALADLRRLPLPRRPDVLLLQEMDPAGTAWLAQELGMNHVHRPSYIHPQTGRLFGNAILSPWPLQDAQVVVLPHANPLTDDRRTALAVDVMVAGHRLRTVSLHMGTLMMPLGNRLEQFTTVRDSLVPPGGPVLVGGDMNTAGPYERRLVRRLFRAAGLRDTRLPEAATMERRLLGPIKLGFRMDRFYQRGLEPLAAGVGTRARGSDHRPIWSVYRWQ